jgi:uncharacterized protein HemY
VDVKAVCWQGERLWCWVGGVDQESLACLSKGTCWMRLPRKLKHAEEVCGRPC